MSARQKLTILARTAEPESFVMYCVVFACEYVGETNTVQDPKCPRCHARSLAVWKNRA